MEITGFRDCPHGCHAGCTFEATPDIPQYGKMVCPKCGAFLDWVRDPNGNSRNRRSTKKLEKIFASIDQDYCEFCLRGKDELSASMAFHVHHVVEVRDGGTDEPANLRLYCTRCHELSHLLRRDRQDKDERPTCVKVWW